MAIEHALLGLLAIQPRHGYELSKEFAEGTTLADVVHLEPGMLYAYLKKLEHQGWVEAQIEEQSSRPARRVFHLTGAGGDEFHRWLTEPVEKTRDIRLEFLLKLYLARHTNPELTDQMIRDQQKVCAQFITSLNEQLTEEPDDFRALVLRMRLAQNEALEAWLTRTAKELPPVAD